jgi:electron transfer flavoprotein beta subunit
MGADRAIQIDTAEKLQPLTLARAFLKIIEKEQPGLVILGKQAIDDDNSQTGQMLAALWDRPQATFASGMTLAGDSVTVVREVDAGLETIEIDLPAVITVDLRLNEPRFVKLPDIMKAKRKPLDVIALADLGVSSENDLQAASYAPPPVREKGIMVEDAAQLVAELKNRGLV